MAVQAYVKITGTKQGKFKAPGGKSAQFADAIPVLRFESVASAPRDIATGQASGKQQWQPIRLTKEWDAASPQIISALTSNEVLSTVVFEFWRPDVAGKLQMEHRITLKSATIVTVDSTLDLTAPAATPGAGRELETIELTFQSITVENLTGKTSVTDTGPVIAAQPQPVAVPQPTPVGQLRPPGDPAVAAPIRP